MIRFFKYFLPGVVLLALTACGNDSLPDPSPGTPTDTAGYTAVNEWVYGNMDYYYLWTDQLPDKEDTDLTLYPGDYFETLRNKADRFSWITDNTGTKSLSFADDTYAYDYGFGFGYFERGENIVIVATQVVPGSPADKAGVRRGDCFTHWNGTAFTLLNWYSGLYESASVSLTQCRLRVFGNTLSITDNVGTVTLTKTNYYNTPIIYDTILKVENTPIGYLVYDSYVSGEKNTFTDDLKKVFKNFKENQVSELVLDLRYNPGGELDVILDLAAMIAPAEDVRNKKEFAYLEYNHSYSSQLPEADKIRRFSMSEADIATYNLGLDRLIVIAMNGTASASEVTMHCLSEFMPVEHYGLTTTGKNVGSIGISSTSLGWSIQPIVSRIFNRSYPNDPSYASGLVPTVEVEESVPLDDFGVTDGSYEYVLGQALRYAGILSSKSGQSAAAAEKAETVRIEYPSVRDRGILIRKEKE